LWKCCAADAQHPTCYPSVISQGTVYKPPEKKFEPKHAPGEHHKTSWGQTCRCQGGANRNGEGDYVQRSSGTLIPFAPRARKTPWGCHWQPSERELDRWWCFATGVTAVDRVAKLAQTARLHVPFSSAARDQGFWQKASKSKHSWDGENQDLALVTSF